MNLSQVVRYFGSQASVCKALGINRSSFSQWIANGYIPYKRQLELENISNGKIKANFTEINEALDKKYKN